MVLLEDEDAEIAHPAPEEFHNDLAVVRYAEWVLLILFFIENVREGIPPLYD